MVEICRRFAGGVVEGTGHLAVVGVQSNKGRRPELLVLDYVEKRRRGWNHRYMRSAARLYAEAAMHSKVERQLGVGEQNKGYWNWLL